MDPRFQPTLDHPASSSPLNLEARALFASGWHSSHEEGRIIQLTDGAERIANPATWHALRELAAQVPVQLVRQAD